ncbi:MAG: tRNA (cytidine(56)-2'-O)-methyltransferase [Nitrosopumilaceae archaeon]|nr:tRNA (cytidine(56)-2'-O)-methyltransferase [Nitrosopumilaceae archaeon]
MEIEVVRIGQRVVRDDRVTTHVALVSRAFGASKIYMNEINPEIKETLQKINDTWGGEFEVKFENNLKEIVKKRKSESYKIIHLTMYGENIDNLKNELEKEDKIVIIVGAEKVPREFYHLADYNIAVGNQPHSEISALAITLDRINKGKQFQNSFANAKRRIIPSKQGKNVIVNKKRD